MGILLFLLSVFGCSKRAGDTQPGRPQVTKTVFSKYTQEDQRDYIRDYLQKTYGVKCDISEVHKKTIGSGGVLLESYYSAIATIDENQYFHVWITDQGVIIDSFFELDLKKPINLYFADVCVGVWNRCIVRTWISFESIPQKQWGVGDDVLEFLKTENVCAHVNVFVDESERMTEMMLGKICEKMEGLDVDLCLYRCPNIEDFDPSTFDYSSFIYTKRIEKSG